MRFPKVNIQIPHYNNAQYMKECIESCLRLTYPNFHIHFFDDSSTDHTQELICEIHSDKMTKYRHERNIGRVANYQFAFSKNSDAEWFVNLDSDDYYTESDWLNEPMKIISENPDDHISHIQCNLLRYVDIAKINPIKAYGNNYYLIRGIDYLKLCIENYSFSHLGSIFHAPKVAQYGGYTEDCMHTDFFTAMRVAIHGNVLIGKTEVGHWREVYNNQSSSRYSEAEYLKNEMAYYRFFEFCENYIALSEIKKIIALYEDREFEKKIVLDFEKNKSVVGLMRLGLNERKFNSTFLRVVFANYFKKFGSSHSVLNISHGLFTKAISALLTLLMIPLLIQSLGMENYGWIGVYTAIISTIYIFDFGISNIITKEVSQRYNNTEYTARTIINTLEVFYYAVGIFILIFICILAPILEKNWFHRDISSPDSSLAIIRLIGIAVFFQWPHSFYTGALYGLQKQIDANNNQLIMAICKNALLLLLYFLGHIHIMTFFYIQIAVSVITTISQKYLIYRELHSWNILNHFSFQYLLHIKNLAFGITVIGLFGFIYTDLNNILLSKWLSLHEFGLYNIVFNVIVSIILLTATIKNSLFREISLSVHQELKLRKDMYIRHFNTISYLCIPLLLFVFINSRELLTLWLHDTALTEKLNHSLKWMSLGSLFYSLMIIPWAYLIANNKTKYLVYHCGILAMIAIPLLYQLTSRFNFEGGSIYWFAINFLPSVLMVLYVQFRLFGKPFLNLYSGIALPVVLSLVMGGLYYFAYTSYPIDMFGHIVLIAILIMLIYGSLYNTNLTDKIVQ